MSGVNIRIGADTSDLERGLSTSQKMLRDNARQMQRNIGVVAKYTAAIIAAGAALSVHLVRQTMNAIDEQSKLARSLGTSVDALTALQIAGDRAGIAQGSLNAALATFTARLGEARRGTGQGIVAFERLGLEAEELAAIPLDEQMQLIGERVRGLGLDASQTADLMRNLGIRNREMIGFIREGTADIDNARAMMRQFGLEISDVDAKRIEDANDAIAKIGMTAKGLRQVIAVELAGPLEDVAETLSKMFGDMGDDLREGIEDAVKASLLALADFIDGAANVANFINQNPIMAQFGVLGMVLLGPKGAAIGTAIGAVFQIIEKRLNLLGIGIGDVGEEILELANVQNKIDVSQQVLNHYRQQEELIFGASQAQGALAIQIERTEQKLAELNTREQELLVSTEGVADAQDQVNIILGQTDNAMTGVVGGARTLADEIRKSVVEAKNLNEETAKTVVSELGDGEGDGEEFAPVPVPRLSDAEREALQERLDVLQDSREDELEALAAFLTRKEEMILEDIANEVGNAEELQKLLLDVQREGGIAQEALAERQAKKRSAILSESMSNLTSLMQSGSRELFAIGKAAALSEAIVNAQAAVTSSFARGSNIGGPIVGAAFAATAAAATGVQISRLASTQFGSTNSGQPATGSGAGGSVSQAQAAPQSTGQSQSLLVQGDFSQDQLFTGSTVRKLIESIAEQQRDGFTVVI